VNRSARFALDAKQPKPRAQLRALITVPQFQRGDADCRGSDLIDELREIVQKTLRTSIVRAASSHRWPSGITYSPRWHWRMRLLQINAPLPELYLYAVHVDGALCCAFLWDLPTRSHRCRLVATRTGSPSLFIRIR
jgi:hypothetical protein